MEELYFFRRYEEGARFARRVLGEEEEEDADADGGGDGARTEEGGAVIDGETRRLLVYYLERCLVRAEGGGRTGGEGRK